MEPNRPVILNIGSVAILKNRSEGCSFPRDFNSDTGPVKKMDEKNLTMFCIKDLSNKETLIQAKRIGIS